MANPRLFLVDPMCVLDYGHNPQSLIYFGRYFSGRGFNVQQAVCKHFPLTEGAYGSFQRRFSYYYQDFVPLKLKNARPEKPGKVDSPTLRYSTDPLEHVATADFMAWLQAERVDGSDYVFYPSVDFYGVAGLLGAYATMPKSKVPQTHLRFIGVMENGTQRHTAPLRYLRGLLDQVKLDDKISISAEAPVYAAHLTSMLRRPCTTALYPLAAAPEPLSAGNPFIVYSAGTARLDKGFLRLYNIISKYSRLYPEDEVEFHIQGMRPQDEANHLGEISQLYAAPNVTLHNAVQTDEAMEALYRKAHFLIMPYDFEIYRFRGSAVFMEGIVKGRPFAISAGTGFHPLVEGLDSAFNCTHDEDFCHAIHACYTLDRAELAARAQKTAREYERMALDSLDTVWRTRTIVKGAQ